MKYYQVTGVAKTFDTEHGATNKAKRLTKLNKTVAKVYELDTKREATRLCCVVIEGKVR